MINISYNRYKTKYNKLDYIDTIVHLSKYCTACMITNSCDDCLFKQKYYEGEGGCGSLYNTFIIKLGEIMDELNKDNSTL